MAVATPEAVHQFLAAGDPPDRYEWLDEDGRTIERLARTGAVVRLRKRTDHGYVSIRIAVEDLAELSDVLPPEVWEC